MKISEIAHIYDRMLESNEFLRGFYEDYEEKARPARESIMRVMEAKRSGIMVAVKALIATSVRHEHAVWYMSAAIDLINDNKTTRL